MGELHQIQAPMDLYYSMPNRNLLSYLARQERGQPDVYTTTLFKGRDFEKVIGEWEHILMDELTQWPGLLDYELEMRAKIGPMSVQKPLNERMVDVQAYYNLSEGGKPLATEAVKLLKEEWGNVRGLQLISREDALADMKKSTNSGSPYFNTRRRAEESLLPFSIRRVGVSNYALQLPKWSGKLTATLGWRGQEGGPSVDDVKQRVLWMFPFSANVDEARVYQVLIRYAQQRHLVAGWHDWDEVDKRMHALFHTKSDNDYVICTDFSKFDQHFGPELQAAAKAFITSAFQSGPDLEYWLENIFPMKYDIPLCVKKSHFTLGMHGMGSGSGGTNADETLAHRMLQLEAAFRKGVRLNPNSMCLGDDGCLSYPGIAIDDIIKSYTSHGLAMNPSKQMVSRDEAVFLRRWYSKAYEIGGMMRGVYSTMRALGHLLYLERFHDPKKWGTKAVAMRQLSILENCRFHPLGERFVKFVAKGDKFALGATLPGFLRRLDTEYAKAKANDTLYVTYSAMNDPRPPSEWWVTNIVRHLA